MLCFFFLHYLFSHQHYFLVSTYLAFIYGPLSRNFILFHSTMLQSRTRGCCVFSTLSFSHRRYFLINISIALSTLIAQHFLINWYTKIRILLIFIIKNQSGLSLNQSGLFLWHDPNICSIILPLSDFIGRRIEF